MSQEIQKSELVVLVDKAIQSNKEIRELLVQLMDEIKKQP
jgi:hypothetical protein